MSSSSDSAMLGEEGIPSSKYQVYSSRWILLLAVTLLNLANYSHWVAFASVAKQAAGYYQVSGPEVDLIPMISYGLCIPFCLLAVYVVERKGLRFGLLVGACLTAIGGSFCCLATLPGVWGGEAWWSTSFAFKLTVVGQALTGMGCPFISCVPTKVSQNWFGEKERTLATLILGMSNPLGLVLGQLITPLMISNPTQVPLLNLVWFLPAIPGFLLTVGGVRTSLPPTPPSPSAATAKSAKRRPFLGTIMKLVKNKAFLVIFLFLGGAMGYISTLQTKLEQILCSKGYSDSLAGLAAAFIIISGFVASFPLGYLSIKTGKLILITKCACIPAILALVVSTWMLIQPSLATWIVVICGILGICSLGIYPIMLELSVECTYPLDESVVTGLCYLSSAIQGSVLMFTENFFNNPLVREEDLAIQTCSASHGGEPVQSGMAAKDYTNYLIYINSYMIALIVIYVIFFNTDYKRAKENASGRLMTATSSEEEESEVFKNENVEEIISPVYVNLDKPAE
eukprot:TRINITY_DN21256_c0_g1_i4.p1 TRINITY_DN21256_c0_g1~~TRINITY_DN21256_c0_g1_i4.p1  ORF type:complete len:512 (-),score=133.86 TRINITY_DN21256_c0_g1_i4:86-1621(-)